MTSYDLYGDTEFVPDDPSSTPRPTPRRGLLARVGAETRYLLPSFPIALAGFIAVFTLVAVGASLTIVWVGLPVLVLGLVAARFFAQVERRRLHRLDGTAIPTCPYPAPPADLARIRRLLWPLRQPQLWLDAAWSVVGFITGTIAWSIAVTWYALAITRLTYWAWSGLLGPDDLRLADWLGLPSTRGTELLLNIGLGLVGLVTLPFVLRLATAVHAVPAKLLLNGRASLHEELDAERASRAAHQDAEARALRRLERDIHDGPQQRLVRLSMDLGRAKKQLADDPERAALILDDALRQTRETVDELRSLTRGIAPPLLVDRGLRVALDELVNRAPIPVALDFRVASTLSPAVETAVYFTVSEALTNIAKHSLAPKAEVSVVEREAIRLDVTVTDYGMGGAHEAKGSGLRGLRSRVEGVGGLFDLDSPTGGPTVVAASLPLL